MLTVIKYLEVKSQERKGWITDEKYNDEFLEFLEAIQILQIHYHEKEAQKLKALLDK